MADLVGGLLLFSCVGIVWAVTGHGLWVVLRTLLAHSLGERCPKCNTVFIADHRCESETREHQPSYHDDLAAILRVLTHTMTTRALDASTIEKLRTFASQARQPKPTLRKPEPPTLTASVVPHKPDIRRKEHSTAPDSDKVTQSSNQAAKPAAEPTKSPLVPPITPHPLDEDIAPAPARPATAAATAQPAGVSPKSSQVSLATMAEAAAMPTDQTPAEREPWTAAIIARFMEKANVRWVELISALLVVGCSIGLVISLWHTLSETTRFFPSLVFLLSTVAVHFAGQYTLRKWKLRSTSRGILHIGLMLIPLSVLVGLLLARREVAPVLDFYSGAVVTLAGACYGYLSFSASRTLSRKYWKIVAGAVMLSILSLLSIDIGSQYGFISRPVATWWMLLPSVVASIAAASLLSVRNLQRRSLPDFPARELAGSVTQVLFAGITPFAFFVMQRDEALDDALWICILIPAFGWTVFSGVLAARLQAMRESSSPNWLPISNGIFLAICLTVTCVALTQLPWNPTTLCTALAMGGGYLAAIAVVAGFPRAFQAGFTCLLSGVSLIPVALNSHSLIEVRWIAFPSVLCIAMCGAAAWGVAALKGIRNLRNDRLPIVGWTGYRRQLGLSAIANRVSRSGATLLATAAALLLLASFEATESRWATPILAITGWPLLLISLFEIWPIGSARFAQRSQNIALGLGLSFTALSTAQALVLHDGLVPYANSLSGAERFGLSLGITSLSWALLSCISTFYRKHPWPAARTVIGWAMGLALPATLLFSLTDASGVWFRYLGWLGPLTTFLGAVVLLDRNYLRISITTTCFWVLPVVHTVFSESIWLVFGGFGYLTAQALVCIAIVTLLKPALATLSDTANHRRGLPAKDSIKVDWDLGLIAISIVFVLGGLLCIAFLDSLAVSFGTEASRLLVNLGEFSPATLAAFLFAIATAQWILFTSKNIRADWLGVGVGTFPILLAMGLGIMAGPTHLLNVLGWTLAVSLIASELFVLVPAARAASARVWDSLFSAQPIASKPVHDLGKLVASITAHRISASILLGLSTAVLLLQELSPEARTETIEKILVLAPALAFLTVRWIVSHLNPYTDAVAQPKANNAFVSTSLMIVMLWVTCVWLGLPLSSINYALPRILLAIAFGLTSLVCISHGITVLLTKVTPKQRYVAFDQGRSHLFAPAMVTWLLLSLLATGLVVMLPAIRTSGSDFFCSWHLLLGGIVCLVAALLQIQQSRRDALRFSQGQLSRDTPALAAATTITLVSPFVCAAFAAWLIQRSSESATSQTQWFLPVHFLVSTWGLVALTLSAVHWRNALARKPHTKPLHHHGILRSVLASAVGGFAVAGTIVDPVAGFPFAALVALSVGMLVEGIVRRSAIWGHFAAVFTSIAIAALLRGSWLGGNLDDGIVHVLWGPIAISTASVVIEFLQNRSAVALDSSQDDKSGSGGIAVQTTTSLLLSVCFLPLSFIVCLWHPPVISWMPFFALQAAATTIALIRCFSVFGWPRNNRRAPAAYTSIVGLGGWIGASIACGYDLGFFESLLLWATAVLSSMSIISFCLKELCGSEGLNRLLFADPVKGRIGIAHIAESIKALHLSVGLASAVPAVFIVIAAPEQTLRLMASALPLVGMTAIAPLLLIRSELHGSKPAERSTLGTEAWALRYAVAALASLTFLLSWWADLPRILDATWPELWIYAQRCMLSFSVLMGAFWGISSLLQVDQDWRRVINTFGNIAFVIALPTGSTLVVLQLTSAWEQSALTATAVTKVLSLCAWLILGSRLAHLAIWSPNLDAAKPSSVSQGQRVALLYGVEFCLLGLSLSAYCHFPGLFRGLIADWWPLWAYAISIGSACVGVLIQRRDRDGRAEAFTALNFVLGQNGLLLPLLPLVGVLILPAGAPWMQWHVYSGILLLGALVYAGHAARLASVPLAGLSGLLILGSYWTTLHSYESLRFLEHPQFWLLPPCLAALLAAESLKKQLSEQAIASIRYSALIIAYTSSTSEVFFEAMGGTLWQAILLMTLALIGVAVGIALRIQSFLYCGATFTFLATLGMVLNAQRAIGSVWPWWVFGIATGAGLIFLLGYFEKNRSAIEGYINRIQRWQA